MYPLCHETQLFYKLNNWLDYIVRHICSVVALQEEGDLGTRFSLKSVPIQLCGPQEMPAQEYSRCIYQQ